MSARPVSETIHSPLPTGKPNVGKILRVLLSELNVVYRRPCDILEDIVPNVGGEK
jgi:hypothetical protein